MQELKITSEIPYYRGTEDFSENGKLIFDGVLFDHRQLNLTLLGFPFKKLTSDLINVLVRDYGLVKESSFINVDMGALIHANDKSTDLSFGNNQFFLAGVYLTVSGDSFLSTVKLEGDKPLDSELYKEYFKPRINNKQSRLERCTMKCKVDIGQDPTAGKTLSSIHIDKFGNYKLYVHANGKNLNSIPAIFDFLNNIGCLATTPYNPTSHILDEGE
jgi:hypothetical protein